MGSTLREESFIGDERSGVHHGRLLELVHGLTLGSWSVYARWRMTGRQDGMGLELE